MSFSSAAKENLVKLRLKTRNQKLCQLAGLCHTCGALYVGRGRGAVFTTETLAVGKQIAALAAALYDLDATIGLSERERRRPLAIVTVLGDAAEHMLSETGLLVAGDGGYLIGETAPAAILTDDDCSRALLRGAFLGSGSCINPYRGYHLEIVARTSAFAEQLRAIAAEAGLGAKVTARRDKRVLYLKGEDVSGFLALIGANSSALKFEDVRTERDFRNYVNRTSNCETANIGKTVNAATTQRAAIETIEEHMGLNRLPAPLYEAAMLRLNHPDATLQELADLAEIGKSGMNHRLERLVRIAKEIHHV